MKIAAILSLLFIFILAPSIAQEPDFCHDLDCPKYTLVAKKEGYEIRNYAPSKWVGTTIMGSSYKQAANDGFDLLFKYISGANSANEKIPMASPVATKIVPGPGSTGQKNFTVLFFTPFAYQANTPTPTDPQLKLVSLPAITAYVYSFGGFETDAGLERYTFELVNKLNWDGMAFVKDFYFTAEYDPPIRVIGRHNEIWLLAANWVFWIVFIVLYSNCILYHDIL